jgi:hypothetical protein
MLIEPKTLEPVITALKRSGYEPFSSPGDRHGSWEWPFFKKSEGMTRFVILAATELEQGDALEVEVWIGAEADQRFMRLQVTSFRVSPEELALVARSHLGVAVMQAIKMANALKGSDLTERYAFRAQVVSARHL